MEAPLHTENVRKNKVMSQKICAFYLTTEYEKRTVNSVHGPTKTLDRSTSYVGKVR